MVAWSDIADWFGVEKKADEASSCLNLAFQKGGCVEGRLLVIGDRWSKLDLRAFERAKIAENRWRKRVGDSLPKYPSQHECWQ